MAPSSEVERIGNWNVREREGMFSGNVLALVVWGCDPFHVLDLVRVGDLLLGKQPIEQENLGDRRSKSSPSSSKPNSVRDKADMSPLDPED
ncbi:hypothetical protein CSPX01_04847 [Colletotrichum filicis]|nr:hypothetical protein CSPX01_04847 [Colletotrichum filicis]